MKKMWNWKRGSRARETREQAKSKKRIIEKDHYKRKKNHEVEGECVHGDHWCVWKNWG